MKRVHIAPTLLEAQLAADVLASVGITAHIFNANAAGALGEVPFMHAEPEVWIEDDAQFERARETLASLGEKQSHAERNCPRCGEANPGNFLSCWHCGQALPD